MNTDLRLKVTMTSHIKTKKLIRLTGYEGFYRLISLLEYVAQNKPTGVLAGLSKDDIELSVDWQGKDGLLVDSLVSVGYLDLDGDTYSIHEWGDHNAYAMAQDERSDKARLSKLKQSYPKLHKQLISRGFKKISKNDYRLEVERYLANASDQLATSTAKNSHCKAVAKNADFEEHLPINEQVENTGFNDQEIDPSPLNTGDPAIAVANASEQLAPSPSPSPSPSTFINKGFAKFEFTQMSDDWVANNEIYDYCKMRGLTVPTEDTIEAFKQHYIANGKKSKNWDAMLKKWIAQQKVWGYKNGTANNTASESGTESVSDKIRANAVRGTTYQ